MCGRVFDAFGCFGKLPKDFKRFPKSFGANREFLEKSKNLKFWLRGPDLGEKSTDLLHENMDSSFGVWTFFKKFGPLMRS